MTATLYTLRVKVGIHRIGTVRDQTTGNILKQGRNVPSGETFQSLIDLSKKYPEKFALVDGPGVQETRFAALSTDELQAELARRTGQPTSVEEVPDASDDFDETYNEMTVAELRQYAKDEGIELASSDNKAEILVKIKAAVKASE